jgi:hypothetical protein
MRDEAALRVACDSTQDPGTRQAAWIMYEASCWLEAFLVRGMPLAAMDLTARSRVLIMLRNKETTNK